MEDEIVAAVNTLRAKYTYLFTTGGIGPTHDDITADAVAKAFGVGIDVDERALTPMKAYYAGRGIELTPARMRMARLPFGSELVENSVSIAPGFKLDNVIVMAGVPNIMHVMLDAATKFLKTGKKMLSVGIDLHRPEGEIAAMFEAHQKRYPEVPMGSYPFVRDGKPGTQLVLRSTDATLLAAGRVRAQDAARCARLAVSVMRNSCNACHPGPCARDPSIGLLRQSAARWIPVPSTGMTLRA